MSSEQTNDVLRIVLIVVAVVVLVPVLMMAFMMPFMGVWGGGMMWNGGFGVSTWWGVGMMLLWVAVIAGGGYLVYRWLSGAAVGGDRALEELRLAYARGELSDEEFEERRRKLTRE